MEILYEAFSPGGGYKYEISRRRDGLFDIRVEKRYTDSDGYMPEDWFQYLPIPDMRHVADSLERAKEIGDECLKNLI